MFAQRMVQGTELTTDCFHSATNLFDAMMHHVSIKGVIAGVIPGRVFLSYVLFYPTDEKWDDILDIVMKDVFPMRSGRMIFTHHLQDLSPPADDHIVPIDSTFLKGKN